MNNSNPSNYPRMKLMTIPESFGQVENGIYRSEMIKAPHFPFIKTLNLKSVLVLSPEPPSKTACNFLNNQNIQMHHLGQQSWFSANTTTSWRPISEEIVKEGLECVLNASSHPILIMCTLGIHETGALIGCLRKLQNWNFNSIVMEYRSFAGNKSRRVTEQFIELFDLDLITLPQNLPEWYLFHLELLAEESKQ